MNPDDIVVKELERCIAPMTGILVAAAFFTDRGTYLGHNIERQNPTIFEHAERMALRNMLESEASPRIRRIAMAGGGKTEKYKYYTPCFACAHAIVPYTDENTEIILAPLPGKNSGMKLLFSEVLASHGQLPYSRFASTELSSMEKELEEKTELVGKDVGFIADLAILGLSAGASFYLTGSASGRGGVSNLLNSRSGQAYRDIDLLAVITRDFPGREADIERLITKHYGSFRAVPKELPPHHNIRGVVFKKTFYYCGPGEDKLLDFTFSTDLKGTLAKSEYEMMNWFHQLS